MRVYRLSKRLYARDLSGEGARLHGGRWNHIGTACLYASQSRSLAVLELSVNVSTAGVLRHLSMVEIEIPGEAILELTIPDLPGNWRDAPAPPSTKDYGTALLNKNLDAIVKVPSSVIPEEFNYLINPKHHRAGDCTIVEVKDFTYDVRIKTP